MQNQLSLEGITLAGGGSDKAYPFEPGDFGWLEGLALATWPCGGVGVFERKLGCDFSRQRYRRPSGIKMLPADGNLVLALAERIIWQSLYAECPHREEKGVFPQSIPAQ